jgi:hypothetical protein
VTSSGGARRLDPARDRPVRLWDKRRRDRALTTLAEHHLAREEQEGKATLVVLNPALGAVP